MTADDVARHWPELRVWLMIELGFDVYDWQPGELVF